jgi:glycosyltransferase involved in cell wall biosynthesis
LPDLDAAAIQRPIGDAPCLVTVGNTSRLKNVRRSLEAFRLVRETYPNAELHLFGPGLDATFAGGEPGVIGHGNVPNGELMSFLEARATLLVHPSLLECCPMAIAEAKARAVPAIGGLRSGGVSFVCGEDAGCLLTDVTDPRAIAAAALQVLSNPTEYRQRRIRARQDIAERFASPKIAQSYAAEYHAVLGRTRPALT